jgi:GNAT superfamily N-acetyltransferase
LPLLGVDPFYYGKGLGSRLLQHALAICDQDNKIANLESSNSRNIPFYERHGFEASNLSSNVALGQQEPNVNKSIALSPIYISGDTIIKLFQKEFDMYQEILD